MPDGTRASAAEIELPEIKRTETLEPHAIVVYEVTVGAY
jgi:hypothetical protein